jgi:hypothetical protein
MCVYSLLVPTWMLPAGVACDAYLAPKHGDFPHVRDGQDNEVETTYLDGDFLASEYKHVLKVCSRRLPAHSRNTHYWKGMHAGTAEEPVTDQLAARPQCNQPPALNKSLCTDSG